MHAPAVAGQHDMLARRRWNRACSGASMRLRPRAVALRAGQEIRICTLGKTCQRQGSKQLLKFAQDLGLSELSVQGCGCLGNCGNGPNMVLLPQEQMLLHVATTADLLYIIRTQCHVDVPDALIQVTEMRLAGNSLAAGGDLQGALDKYRQALALACGRGDHLLHSNAAAACLEMGRHEEALQHALQAVDSAPVGFHNAPIRLIDALYALGRFSEAAAALEQAVTRHPGFTALPEYRVIKNAMAQAGRKKQRA